MAIQLLKEVALASCGASIGYAVEHAYEANNPMAAVAVTAGGVTLPIVYHVFSKVLSEIVTYVCRPSLNSSEWNLIHTWNLEKGKVARLFRSGNYLMTESNVNGKVVRLPFKWKDKRIACDSLVVELKKRNAKICEDGSISFITEVKSALNNVMITEDEWGVTIVDTGKNKIDPTTWGGHAAIIVESIEGSSYKIQIGHLRKEGGKIKILLDETTKMPHINSRSQTWVRSKELVSTMLKRIKWEADQSRNCKGIGIGDGKFSMFITGKRYDLINCMTWARRRVYLADIDVPSSINMFSWETPKRYLGSRIKAFAQETLGFISKSLLLVVPSGGVAAFVVATPVVAVMAPTMIITYGIESLFLSIRHRVADRREREKFKDLVLNHKWEKWQ